MVRTFLQVAAGAADIPVTRLLGQSPAGLSATGESDVRNYYDMIAARQELDLRPQLERLDRIILRSEGLDPDALTFAFRPLWQLDAPARAALALAKAQATQVYAGLGLWPPEVMARLAEAQLVADGTYPNAAAVFAEVGTAPVEDASTGDAFPAGLGALHYLTEPREANGRWTTGASSGPASLPEARLTLVSDPEEVKKRFEEGLAGGPGPLDDPALPAGEDPLVKPLPGASTHGPLQNVPSPLTVLPTGPQAPAVKPSTASSPSVPPVASTAPLLTPIAPSQPALQSIAGPIQAAGRTPGFTHEETTSLVQLFRAGGPDGNETGAQLLLRQIAKGDVRLPDGITRDLLARYAVVARDAIDSGIDKRGVQALRLQAINQLLGNQP